MVDAASAAASAAALITAIGGALAALLTNRARRVESEQKTWAETHMQWLAELKKEAAAQRKQLDEQSKTLAEQMVRLGKLQLELSEAKEDLTDLHRLVSEFLTAHDLWQVWEDATHGQHPLKRPDHPQRDANGS